MKCKWGSIHRNFHVILYPWNLLEHSLSHCSTNPVIFIIPVISKCEFMISSFCMAQELREKNWKAMDALSEMEKNVNNKVKTAVQKIKVEKYLHSSRMFYNKLSIKYVWYLTSCIQKVILQPGAKMSRHFDWKLVTHLWNISLTTSISSIQSYFSKFWAWSCVPSNFDREEGEWQGQDLRMAINDPIRYQQFLKYFCYWL